MRVRCGDSAVSEIDGTHWSASVTSGCDWRRLIEIMDVAGARSSLGPRTARATMAKDGKLKRKVYETKFHELQVEL